MNKKSAGDTLSSKVSSNALVNSEFFINNISFSPTGTNRQKNKILEMWHYRLAHASVNVLKYIPSISLSSKGDLKPICHLAKQHRLNFERSDSMALHVFDIIHIDI